LLPAFFRTTYGKDGGAVFLTARKGRTTLEGLCTLDRKSVMGVIDYPRLAMSPAFCASAVVICDVERMTPAFEARVAGVVRDWLETDRPPRVLNAPPKTLRRYELLKKLFKLGVNRTDIHRLDDPYTIEKVAFPCFIREEAGHHLHAESPRLLQSRDELAGEVARLQAAGAPLIGKLAVEFEDTRDDTGMYCKRAYYKVGEALIPAHLFWNTEWFVKFPPKTLMQERPDLVERERAFVETSAQEDEVARLFDLAGVEFGRIDYGVRADGGIHVFEINTNPNHSRPGAIQAVRKDYIQPVQQRIVDAIAALAASGPSVALRWPRDELIYRLQNQT